ncbi:MAG TPA: TIGR00269 family protein [Thermoplasmata archaeon]|nr:TIGR00269 family protein [Thermoplasmata archaeon]
MACDRCDAPPVIFIRYSGAHLCAAHFREYVERRVKQEIRRELDLSGGATKIAVGLSGGKDSSTTLVLLHDYLGRRTDVTLEAITVDEGIAGYRPPSLETAKALCAQLGVAHHVVSYQDTQGFEMDRVVRLDPDAIPCSYCGVFRRHALNETAREIGADFLATGLNLDDTAESILMNVARGDVDRLARLGPHEHVQPGLIPRLQPLRMIPELEAYLYAFLRQIPFHDAECPYAARAQRGRFKELLHRLEGDSPGTRHAIVRGYDGLRPALQAAWPPASLRACARCGEPTIHDLCKACELRGRLESLAAT